MQKFIISNTDCRAYSHGAPAIRGNINEVDVLSNYLGINHLPEINVAL